MEYVVFEPGEQRKFLREVKKRSKRTWKDLSLEIGRHNRMMFFYLQEKNKMSVTTYKKLARYVQQKYAHSTIELRNSPVECTLPETMSDELAEFLGILAGDGHMGKHYVVCVVISKLVDKEYAPHVKELFCTLFDIQAVVFTENNTLKIRVYSKKLQSFLHQKCGLPIGKKKGNLRIPNFENRNFSCAYIRGLFDTDGSFYERGNSRGVVNISTGDPNFGHEVVKTLTDLGFRISFHGRNIVIYRRKEIRNFFSEVQPSNPKHWRRYEKFLNKYDLPRMKADDTTGHNESS